MNSRQPGFLRRSASAGAVTLLVAVVAACTGRGGGYLPPGPSASDLMTGTSFSGQASFGFDFSCQDAGGTNPPTGQLTIELSYTDHGTSVLATAPFSVHGVVDEIDPVLESEVCIGKEPPTPGNELIFLGRFKPTSTPPAGFPATCATRAPLCRFEVIVRDNDGDLAPSANDFFSIKLSGATGLTSEFDSATVFYARAGFLAGGNLTVK